jgi:hypothetical protein
MSYAILRAMGTFESMDLPDCGHLSCILKDNEVFVVRFRLSGIKLTSADQLRNIVRAVGQSSSYPLDVRGVAVWRSAGMGAEEQMVDVPVTVRATFLGIPTNDNRKQIGDNVQQRLAAVFPKAVVGESDFGQLTASAAAIDHWRAQAPLWLNTFTSPGGPGGPTAAFATTPEGAFVSGKADDAPNAPEFVKKAAPPSPPKKPGELGAGQVLLVAAVGMGLYLGWRSLKKQKEKETR